MTGTTESGAPPRERSGTPGRRPNWLRLLQIAATIALVGFAAYYMWDQWRDASSRHLEIRLHWGWLSAASLIVLATYAFLVQIWRVVLARCGASLPFGEASRIWFVSNLGKYVPGKVWQVTTMMEMLRRDNIPLGIAGSVSAILAIANVVAGFVLLVLLGAPAVEAWSSGYRPLLVVVTVISLAALVTAPLTIRWLTALVARVRRAPMNVAIPASASWFSLAGCAIAWLAYGLAFQLLCVALLGPSRAPWTSYFAAFTLSYLVGYLVLFAPGGIGARESVLLLVLPALGIATPAEAIVVSVVSRLWLTALEVVPGVLFLARGRR
jgi:glycosyltransferase 2 family protein